MLHWSLAAGVAAAWWTREQFGPAHEYIGYAVAAVVAARLAWGFVGGRYARFSQFVRGVRPTLDYACEVRIGTAPRYIGHNPLGGWMVLALLAGLSALTFSGWLYTTDLFWGYGWLALLHECLAWGVLALVALHVAGVVFTSWKHRENLVQAMVTGRKPEAETHDVD